MIDDARSISDNPPGLRYGLGGPIQRDCDRRGPFRVFCAGVTLFVGFLAVSGVRSQHWFKHGRGLAGAYVVLVAVAVIWGCARAWRIRLHLNEADVTVRN
jgi:hypothetical protein